MRPPFDTNLAFVAVGSNIAPETHIPLALQQLIQHTTVLATSTFYRTAPLGPPNQPPFINGVWLLQSPLAPRALRDTLLLPLETQLGRVRGPDPYAPRPLDLDLVLYNDWQCAESDLHLPHPDLERPFVNQPVREILTTTALPEQIRARILALLPPSDPDADTGVALPVLTQALRRCIRV
jgi:2-amino-4-hydroxy-6-hydroxymethyldihydropteridine diphosphokinase